MNSHPRSKLPRALAASLLFAGLGVLSSCEEARELADDVAGDVGELAEDVSDGLAEAREDLAEAREALQSDLEEWSAELGEELQDGWQEVREGAADAAREVRELLPVDDARPRPRRVGGELDGRR